jgi:hypothetical protein
LPEVAAKRAGRTTTHRHSQIAALGDQLEWLREAGLQSVDRYWKYLDLSIAGGAKESAGRLLPVFFVTKSE